MAEELALVYLEADDEVTTVVRRLRAARSSRVVLVAPGRARATSSAVALRLLARVAADGGREVGIVGDALTRSLAAEAGLAAYLTVNDARAAVAVDPADSRPQRASIHVVRAADDEETAPTMASAPAAPTLDPSSAETRSVPTPGAGERGGRQGGAPPRPRRRWRTAVMLATLLLLLGAGIAAAVVVLPSAQVTVEPRTEPIDDVTYAIDITEYEPRRGDATAAATVTATGTYDIEEPATGTVTLRNFSGDPVAIAPGTFVAAGEQAFATVVPVTVPAGSLTPDGRIQAGEADVAIEAAAAGPDGNVDAQAIDVVLSPTAASRLRAFENNQSRLVVNAEPTTGGAIEQGHEITQEDVDRALTDLDERLAAEVAEALGVPDALVVPATADSEPVVEGADDLAGTRDVESVEITGTLAYDVRVVPLDAVRAAATERLAADTAARRDGYMLDEESVRVDVTEAASDGASVRVDVEVTGRIVRDLPTEQVVDRIRGLEASAAEAALSDLVSQADVELWPMYASAVPTLDWRIEVIVAEPQPQPEPSASSTPQPAAQPSGSR